MRRHEAEEYFADLGDLRAIEGFDDYDDILDQIRGGTFDAIGDQVLSRSGDSYSAGRRRSPYLFDLARREAPSLAERLRAAAAAAAEEAEAAAKDALQLAAPRAAVENARRQRLRPAAARLSAEDAERRRRAAAQAEMDHLEWRSWAAAQVAQADRRKEAIAAARADPAVVRARIARMCVEAGLGDADYELLVWAAERALVGNS